MKSETLQGNLKAVQKKTFTKWINSKLHHRRLYVKDLYEDVKDGALLLVLLEVMTGSKVRTSSRFFDDEARKQQQNIMDVLHCLKSNQVPVEHIPPSDIASGSEDSVLALVWLIIQHLEIQEVLSETDTAHDMVDSGLALDDRQQLLAWVHSALSSPGDPEVRDFDESWKDGTAFLALVRHITSDLSHQNDLDIDVPGLEDSRSKLQLAFTLAEEKLGITSLLDPEDVEVEKPDERSIMTYVTQFVFAQQLRLHHTSLKRSHVHRQEDPSAFWFFVVPTAAIFLAIYIKNHIDGRFQT